MTGSRSRQLLIAGSVLVVGLLAGLVTPHDSYAHIAACRSDPTLTLSNGAKLTLYEDVSDVASDITSVAYQVYVPVGVKVTSIQYSGDVPSSQQTITVTANENAGNYDAYTQVLTQTPSISVTAYMSGISATGAMTTSTHTSGHSGQQLHSHLHFQ